MRYTRDQLLTMHCQNEAIVDAIIATKRKHPDQWKPHPDCPGCEAAILYKAMGKEEESLAKENVRSSETELKALLNSHGMTTAAMPMY